MALNHNTRNKSILRDKSYEFAIRIVKLSQYLQSTKSEYILSKQIMRSGTAVGALIREAEFAQSTADFINKLSISLKEANETIFWLNLLKDTDYIDDTMFESMEADCKDILSILVSSVKTLKLKTKSEKF